MTKKLLDKIGFNVMHDWTDTYDYSRVERAIAFSKSINAKYIRPALRLLDDDYAGNLNQDRVSMTKNMIANNLTPIWGPVPIKLQWNLKASNYNDLLNETVTVYANIMDQFLKAGISANDFIFEGWNEADGYFAMKDGSAQTDTSVINNYLEFNKRVNDECHKRGIRFMDLDSVCYPKAPELKTVMDTYNQKMASYSSKPDYISFHPYCERKRDDNNIPEKLLIGNNMNLNDWNNLSGIPLCATEFGYPTEEWGKPFSGNYPYQYAKDMFVRQVIVMDYLNVDPIILYSANVNADADSDDCWGVFQYDKNTKGVTFSSLGSYEYQWFTSMYGYHLNGMVTPNNLSSLDNANVNMTDFAFEYENDKGHKKLFYWNPFGHHVTNFDWNNKTYRITFSQHVNLIEA